MTSRDSLFRQFSKKKFSGFESQHDCQQITQYASFTNVNHKNKVVGAASKPYQKLPEQTKIPSRILQQRS